MSNESYYVPKTTEEKAQEIRQECEKIIAKAMLDIKSCDEIISKTKFVEKTSDVCKQDSKAQCEVINGVWEEKSNNSYKVELEGNYQISYRTTITQGEIIDYSKLSKSRNTESLETIQTNDEQKAIMDKYFVLLDLLDLPQEKISIEEMGQEIISLEERYVQQSEKKYIRDNIYDVFSKQGYNIEEVKWQQEEVCDVEYPDLRYARGRITSFNDEFLFESYGVTDGKGEISNEQKKKVVNEEIEICRRNLIVEAELKERGIIMVKRYSYEPGLDNLKYEQNVGKNKNRVSTNSTGEEKV